MVLDLKSVSFTVSTVATVLFPADSVRSEPKGQSTTGFPVDHFQALPNPANCEMIA